MAKYVDLKPQPVITPKNCNNCIYCKKYDDMPRFANCLKSHMPFHIDARPKCIFFEPLPTITEEKPLYKTDLFT